MCLWCEVRTLAACGWSRQDTVAAFLYQTAQGMVSAAMKLLPVGQQQGQQLLAGRGPMNRPRESSGDTAGRPRLVVSNPRYLRLMRHARLELAPVQIVIEKGSILEDYASRG